MSVAIGPMAGADWNDVARIYEEGLAGGDASFETSAPTWTSWDEHHLPECRLVARDTHEILGWAALSGVSDRCVYGGVAEVGIYVTTGTRERLGKLDDHWRDVLLLERRSEKIGL